MRLISLMLITLIPMLSLGQERIESLNFKFFFPKDLWQLEDNQQVGKKEIWIYKRNFLIDEAERAIVPNFAIISEEIETDINVIEYSAFVRTQVKFNVEKVFSRQTGEISLKKAVGYIGNYTDKNDMLHRIYVIHALYDGKGIQIIGDITDSVNDQMHEEMMGILKSIEYKKKK